MDRSIMPRHATPHPRVRARCLAPNAPVAKLSDVKKLIKERAAAEALAAESK